MWIRGSLVCVVLFALLIVTLAPASTPSYALGKATSTPPATEIPENLDIEQALEDTLKLLEEAAYEDAVTLAERIMEEDADAWRAYYYRGFARVQLKDLEAGIEDYTAVLELRPWDSRFWRLRGELHLQDRFPRQASSDFRRSLFYDPRSTQTYHSLANLHERDVDKRLYDLYRTIVEARQANSQGASNRAFDLLTAAIDKFDRGSIPAELGYAYFARAGNWSGQERWDEALADLAQALELQPTMQDYYLARGLVYEMTERPALAGRDFFERMNLLERDSFESALGDGEMVKLEMAQGLVARLGFEGEAGQRVTIAARDFLGAGVDPLMVLLDTEGRPLLGSDDGGGVLDSLISDYELPTDGAYTAMISHANGGFKGKVRVSLHLQADATD